MLLACGRVSGGAAGEVRPPKEMAIPQSHTSDDEALFWDVFYPPGTIGGNIRLMFGLMAIAGAIVTFLLMRVRGGLNEGESILLTSCIWIPVGLYLFISISISDREFRCMSREFNGMHFMRVYLLEDQVSGRISRALRENGIQLIETRSGAHTAKHPFSSEIEYPSGFSR